MITSKHTISEILTINDNAAEILTSYGMGCIGCPSAQSENLEDAAEIHGLDLQELLKALNAK